jgi:transcriptional regulator with XRE-family HTH domain
MVPLNLVKSKKRKSKKETPWEPEYRTAKRDLSSVISANEPGLPGIHSVKKTSTLPKELSWGHMREDKIMASQTIENKLNKALEPLITNARFNDDNTQIALEEMMRITASPRRFDDKNQFSQFLTEGVVLNINRLVSQSIGIPQGEYVLYNITAEKAMLVPTAEVTVQETDFTKSPKIFEIHTKKLLGCWNKIEGTITEDENIEQTNRPPKRFGRKEIEQTAKSKYQSVPEVVSALEKAGKTQEEVADEIGVHPSTVSRYKRATSKKGGRIPSLGAALKLADATGGDIEAMFGNVEQPTKHRATSGSGGGHNPTFRQGNVGESIVRESTNDQEFSIERAEAAVARAEAAAASAGRWHQGSGIHADEMLGLAETHAELAMSADAMIAAQHADAAEKAAVAAEAEAEFLRDCSGEGFGDEAYESWKQSKSGIATQIAIEASRALGVDMSDFDDIDDESDFDDIDDESDFDDLI